jgi:hypothetical protein
MKLILVFQMRLASTGHSRSNSRRSSARQGASDSRIFYLTSKSGRDCDFETQSTFLKVPGVVVVEVEEDTLFPYRGIDEGLIGRRSSQYSK